MATPARKRQSLHASTSSQSQSSSITQLLASQPSQRLTYSVSSVSSYSGTYHPSHIIDDFPNDLGSRWSGTSVTVVAPLPPGPMAGPQASGSSGMSGPASSASTKNMRQTTLTGSSGPINGKQHIVLKLPSPAIVKSIYFGKYHKSHPCNLRDLKVYGGFTPDPHSGRWIRLLRTGLKNDSTPEEFRLKWTNAQGVPLPIQYIKIVPLATHSPNYNFSVWHVALHGCSERSLINKASNEYAEFCESTTTRLILKHLRARGHHSAFQELLQSSQLHASEVLASENLMRRPFEDPIVTRLFQAIMRGDWDTAEHCLDQSAGLDEEGGITNNTNLFASFLEKCSQQAHWTRLYGTDANGDIPSPRGGHHMVVDSNHQMAYLFGGFDGKRELNDLWIYYMNESRWRCVSRNTSLQGGPSPRSCHKMAFDSRSGLIYVFGRFVDSEAVRKATNEDDGGGGTASGSSTPRPQSSSPGPRASSASAAHPPASNSSFLASHTSPQQSSSSPGSQFNSSSSRMSSSATLHPSSASRTVSLNRWTTNTLLPVHPFASDFYRFSTRSERWDRLSDDTNTDGGPKLVYDPDMVVDEENQMLYIFGGRVAHWDPKHLEYSGLWRYDCIQRTWAFLFDDEHPSSQLGKIPCRAGHCMLFDKGRSGDSHRRQLWILGGQRGDQYLADMHTYNLATGEVRQIDANYEVNAGGPEGGFTQRAVIDAPRREIYLFSGLTRRKRHHVHRGKEGVAMWMYSILRDTWSIVWQGKGEDADAKHSDQDDDEDDDDEEESDDIVSATEHAPSAGNGGDGDETMEESGGADVQEREPLAATSRTPSRSGTVVSEPRGRKRSRREREPAPRFASAMVFEPKSQDFLVFGGNPTPASGETNRLNDLWSLRLTRPHTDEVLRRAKFVLRQQRFKEMAASVPRTSHEDPEYMSLSLCSSFTAPPPSSSAGIDGSMLAMEALVYLQTEVSAVVDHSDPHESRVFRKLVSGLLRGGDSDTGFDMAAEDGDADADQTVPADGSAAAAGNDDEDDDDTASSILTATASPMRPPRHARQVSRESDGLPAIRHHNPHPLRSTSSGRSSAASGEDDTEDSADADDTEMLSISQTLPSLPRGDGSNTVDLNKVAPLLPSQRPSPLFQQRLQLYRQLLEFYPAESIEPRGGDLEACVDTCIVRNANRGLTGFR